VLTDLRMYSASDEDGVFELRAPASGIIVSKTITPGSQVAAEGEPLFTVSDLSEVWVNLNIYAGHVAHVKEGMEAGIVTLAYPGEVFTGRIAAIAQVFDNDERVLKARVVLPNPGMRLKPGMLVDVKVKQQTGGEALAVPSGALVFNNDRHFLISHHDDCDLRVRAVKVLSKDNGTSFVTGDIAAGDRIITRNQLIIYEQVKGE
jgi:membrane fusion protein, heavy metal efflux system